MTSQIYFYVAVGVLALISVSCRAQDYDDESYGPSGQGVNGNYGNERSNNNNNNGAGYGSDDGYSGNMPNYQQNVDSEGSNNNPTSQQYSGQGSSDPDGDYEGDDGSAAAAASSLQPTIVRVRRSTTGQETGENLPAKQHKMIASESEPKLRVKRHGKYYIGPVYTYVKTDKHANFKWGVKHKVGKKHHG